MQLLIPAAPGSILGIPKNFKLDIAEIYSGHCLEQWLDNVNQTHLVLASGKLVLQKSKQLLSFIQNHLIAPQIKASNIGF